MTLKYCVFQLVFLYLSKTYKHILNTIVDKCYESDPFVLNSLKFTFDSNHNARILLILYSKLTNKR